MKTKLFIMILSFLLMPLALAKKPKNNIEESQEREMEMIRRLLGAEHFQQMDDRLEMLMKKFMQDSDTDDIDKFFDRSHFNKFLHDWNPHQGLDEGESHWMETPTERILILKLEQAKDSPIDIKIQNKMIQISGKNVLKSAQGTSISTFSKAQSVPEDVDANSAEIENKNGDIQIRFKKLVAGNTKTLKKIVPTPKKESTPDLRPLKKRADEEVI